MSMGKKRQDDQQDREDRGEIGGLSPCRSGSSRDPAETGTAMLERRCQAHTARGGRCRRQGAAAPFTAAMLLALLTACASTPGTEKLAELELGLSRAETVERLGPPTAVRGSLTNKYGQTVEVLEYMLAKPQTSKQRARASTATVLTLGLASPLLAARDDEDYWLYFVDDELVRWGQAGDWREAADRIYEIRFGTGDELQ